MAIGEDFLETSNRGGFIVDKTLTCKALLESPDKAVRICLPRRFGKTFNLSVIAQFFNPVTVHDCLGGAGESHFKEAHGRRRTLFCGSLLEKRYPEFVEENFAKTPVIQIDFKNSDGESLGLFNKSLARVVYDATTFWVKAYRKPELLKDDAREEYQALQRTYSETDAWLGEDESKWEKRGDQAAWLFAKLSEFLVAQHGDKYIILADEYDQPLEAALGEEWQAKADKAYLGILMKMFKNNKHLAAGLLVGVHEFKLSDRESGLNSAKELSLTTGRYRGGKAGVDDIGDESPGPLAALFAFTAEDVAELVKRTLEKSENVAELTKRTLEVSDDENARSRLQEHIMGIIEAWYDGYDFGFPAKRYNPWS
ncbi:hypothetical protein H4R21_003263, partial [Coemansia helicoidea]